MSGFLSLNCASATPHHVTAATLAPNQCLSCCQALSPVAEQSAGFCSHWPILISILINFVTLTCYLLFVVFGDALIFVFNFVAVFFFLCFDCKCFYICNSAAFCGHFNGFQALLLAFPDKPVVGAR